MDSRLRMTEIATQVIENTEYKLVAIDHVKLSGRALIRVYFDSMHGITIEHCRIFSRQMEEVIEMEKFLGDNYILEVSSPGLDRPITEKWQFQKNVGRLMRVTFKENGETKTTEGMLKEFSDGSIILSKKVKKSEELETLGFDKIIEAKLILKW